MAESAADPDAMYLTVAAEYGAALERLAKGYEREPDRRRDLLQDIHVALWLSLKTFGGRCSLRTWVYRVGHNTAISQIRKRHATPTFVSLDDLEAASDTNERQTDEDRSMVLERLFTLIHTLKPIDRQVILLYLEDVDAAAIAEIAGLSAVNVATKVHRIKKVLSQRFHEGDRHGA
jgi:RNA polymerase sigma-70 factor (ECF subfamily)